MRAILVMIVALATALPGNAALAESPLTARVVNCEIHVEGSNHPVNALVDLTAIGGSNGLRQTEKIRTTASGTTSATIRLRQIFPGRDINGDWGVSIDIGITRVMVSGCVSQLPSTSTR